MKKYELTDESIEYRDIVLYRIKALKDFSDVKAGDLGGYVENEENLSQKGDCWIYDNAKVFDKARVYGDAKIYENAKVSGNALIHEDAKVHEYAKVYGNANVYGDAEVAEDAKVHDYAILCECAKVFGDANVCDNVIISDYSKVYDSAIVYKNARVTGHAKIYGDAKVHGDAIVYGHARISGDAKIYGDAKVHGDAEVFGNVKIHGDAEVYGDALIQSNKDYTLITGFGTESRTTTFFRSKDENIKVVCGCFYGDIDGFKKQVKETREGEIAEEYLMIADLMEKHFNTKDEYDMKKKEICIEPNITTVGDLRKLDIPDDVEIKINSVYDSEHEEFVPVSCGGFYHEKDNKIYLTPDTISI